MLDYSIRKYSTTPGEVIAEVFELLSTSRVAYPYTKNTVICDTRDVNGRGVFSKLLHREAVIVGNYLVTHGFGIAGGIKPINSCLEAISLPINQCPHEFMRDPKNNPTLQHGILYDYNDRLCVSHLRNENINYVIAPSKKSINYNSGINSIELYPTTIENIDLKTSKKLSIALEILLIGS